MCAGLVLALLLVLCTTYVTSLQRTGEVALLRALGASRWGIAWLFSCENLLLGLVGSIIGACLAVYVAPALSSIASQIAGAAAQVDLPLWCIVPVALCGALTAVIAGLAGSVHAARQDSASIIRSGEA